MTEPIFAGSNAFHQTYIPFLPSKLHRISLTNMLLNTFFWILSLWSPRCLTSPIDQEPLILETPGQCDCSGTNDTGRAGRDYVCRDPRLGPRRLPRRFPLLSFVSDYDRFGGQTPGDFLQKWTSASTGSFIYPPFDGFYLDTAGKPIAGNMTLAVGTEIDRFGSEYGQYVSAADAPYDQRSLPPSNLDTNPTAADYPYNYHVYKVIKEFEVLGGPIAPWFGQPGLGAQFYIGYIGNIKKLIELEYIQKINKTKIERGPGTPNPCG